MLTARPAVRCVTRAPRAAVVVRPSRVVAKSSPKDVDAALEKAMKEAQDCKTDCAAAWDTVEEIAAAKSHMKDNAKADPSSSDPLEDADECRVYED